MRETGAASPDQLPEWSQTQVAELLCTHRWHAFHALDAHGAGERNGPGEPRLRTGVLRFAGGVLKLSQGCYTHETPNRFFVCVDILDYRALVLDPEIVGEAYRIFAGLAQRFARTVQAAAHVETGYCPAQGAAFAAVERVGGWPSDAGLLLFFIEYFGRERVLDDLHRAFGEATVAYARSTVPGVTSALAL